MPFEQDFVQLPSEVNLGQVASEQQAEVEKHRHRARGQDSVQLDNLD